MSTTIHFHANDPQATTVVGQHFPSGPANVEFDTIDIKQGGSTISLFLNETVARAIHAELERLYPTLAAPLSEGDVDALAMAYAEGHEGDAATVSGDGNVPISHPTPSDEAIAAALDELAESPNAAKFGALNHPLAFQSIPSLNPETAKLISSHNANVVALVEKTLGVR